MIKINLYAKKNKLVIVKLSVKLGELVLVPLANGCHNHLVAMGAHNVFFLQMKCLLLSVFTHKLNQLK